jgi:aminoglycoside phosphotransferase family enzyme
MIGKATISQPGSTVTLETKVTFLNRPETYPETLSVKALETHMSWVFLTDHYVYKLKKPVRYDFLNFKTLEARHKFCTEEVRLNQRLAGDTYLGIVPLTMEKSGFLKLDGRGKVIDWLVKMKRLPQEFMLDTVIAAGDIKNEWVQQTAEFLTDFYLASCPVECNPGIFRQKLVKDIELNCRELLRNEFGLSHVLIVGIMTDLLYFVVKHADLFDKRITEGRILDAHGDLRPEHICLAPKPIIIDCLEFDPDLRIMDVAEELSFLALECEMVGAPATGQLFLTIYRWKSLDKIPDTMISFYRAKRAFLRARLCIHHLLEKNYRIDRKKWRGRCEAYLSAAKTYCGQLPEKC